MICVSGSNPGWSPLSNYSSHNAV